MIVATVMVDRGVCVRRLATCQLYPTYTQAYNVIVMSTSLAQGEREDALLNSCRVVFDRVH